MVRSACVVFPIALLLALAGCAASSPPADTTPPGAAPAVSPSPTSNSDPLPAITCDILLAPSTIQTALGNVTARAGTDGSWGYGTTQPSLVTLLEGDPGALNCIWLSDDDPDVGAIISVSTDPITIASARSYLAPKNLLEEIGPMGEQVFSLRGMEAGWTFTESHAFLDGLWVATFSNFTSEAQVLSAEAVASIMTTKF
jgi:hypothetical protein